MVRGQPGSLVLQGPRQETGIIGGLRNNRANRGCILTLIQINEEDSCDIWKLQAGSEYQIEKGEV